MHDGREGGGKAAAAAFGVPPCMWIGGWSRLGSPNCQARLGNQTGLS